MFFIDKTIIIIYISYLDMFLKYHMLSFIKPKYYSRNSNKLFSSEQKIKDILNEKLTPTKLEVKDTSGGCGSMYDIFVESPLFKVKMLL